MASKQSIVIRLSKRVREERQSRGISQEKLGTLAGLHRTYIGMIERAEKNITISNLDKIAKALRLEAADLLK